MNGGWIYSKNISYTQNFFEISYKLGPPKISPDEFTLKSLKCFSRGFDIIKYMAMKKEQIHGFRLLFDEEMREGVRYLQQDLQYKEAKTLFDAAKATGSHVSAIGGA